jgi:hypothetical protein
MNYPARQDNPDVGFRKDRVLDALADHFNVAQFVSFAPSWNGALVQQFARVAGFAPNYHFGSVVDAVGSLFSASPEGRVNVRSYLPDSPRSQEFVYGLSTVDEAVSALIRLAADGLFVIANETVDVADGGVSGVAQGNVIEFAPDDTPRCVEKPGVASLPNTMALSIIEKVYGVRPDLGNTENARIEFSVHPKPRGWKNTHTLVWEFETTAGVAATPTLAWPNRFSRHLGDKAFGLLMAEEAGVPVPHTTVIGRRVAPFTFGNATGSPEIWIRTAPQEPDPGRYTTQKGWRDPFELLQREDPEGTKVMAVLCQSAIQAAHSGAAVMLADGTLAVEGRRGEGDELMLGKILPEPLPPSVVRDVEGAYRILENCFGPIRTEWVHDGSQAWIVQVHRGQTKSLPTVIVPGEATEWVSFSSSDGLDALRKVLADLPSDTGLNVLGEIGLTSHLADVIRKAKRPARVISQEL